METSQEMHNQLLVYQENEITEYHIYQKLASRIKDPENRKILRDISEDELKHYNIWKKYTETEVKPDRWKIIKYCWISKIFGFTFGVKLMERGEEDAQENYDQLKKVIPEADAVVQDENSHEDKLLQFLDEERLKYTGSIVLGLNDALVELTGALAGFTLALQDTNLIALTGSITGIAAALSMGASEYLSTKSEETVKSPIKASIYTGGAYLLTVFLLILPYLLFANYYFCLGCTLAGAILVIAVFNYYVSVAKDENFRRRFMEMAGLSLGVAAFSFLIGFVMRAFFGVDV